jgi:hypothetical protein
MRSRAARTVFALLLAAALPVCRSVVEEPSPSAEPHCGTYGHRATTLKAQGGRVDWSRTNGLIAYDRAGDDGYFDIYVMAADGSRDTCLTCGKPSLVPQKNNGNPAWHPSGNYIVFQSEVANSRASQFASYPGRGINNVLWVTDPTGQQYTQLTELSLTDSVSGVLHPHFSADGGRLSWSEIYEGAAPEPGNLAGLWRLVVADFVIAGGQPTLRNIRKYEPGGPAFYENHGFSPDGSHLIFCSNLAQPGLLQSVNNDIFLMDLGSQALTRLTDANYNEHGQFFPDGRKILWMTNADIPNRGSDLWIMNPDGSTKERLTFFNQAGCPEYVGSRTVPADNSSNAAGDKVVLFVQDEILGSSGSIVMLELDRSF